TRDTRTTMRDFAVPAWRCLCHDRADGGFLCETAHAFNPWHEGFAFGKGFRATAACEMERLSITLQIIQKSVNKRGFTNADVTADTDDAATPLLRLVVCLAEPIPLEFAADDLARTSG